jgi:ferritin-like metal-binding protein YciE
MFERLNTPHELYQYKLGTALKMEQTVVKMLQENIERAHDDAVRRLLERHLAESQTHVENLEQLFMLLGSGPGTSACPAIGGIQKEGKANVRKADEALVDLTILQGAVETEHHEIGVYENLIGLGEAIGRGDTVTFLQTNLRDERRALEMVSALLADLAAKKSRAWGEELAELVPREDD